MNLPLLNFNRTPVIFSPKTIVPSFAQLSIAVGGRSVVSELSSEGRFYLEDVAPGLYAGEVEYADGTCALQLVVPKQHEAVTEVGIVACAPPQVGAVTR